MGKKKKEDWTEDPDVQKFLEIADEIMGFYDLAEKEVEEGDQIYTVGGLTADKDNGFMKFQRKIDKK